MSENQVIWENEIDLNSLHQVVKTPFPDFVYQAIQKAYDNSDINEKSPNNPVFEHSTNTRRRGLKLECNLQHIKCNLDHDGPRVWSNEPLQFHGDEHTSEHTEGTEFSN